MIIPGPLEMKNSPQNTPPWQFSELYHLCNNNLKNDLFASPLLIQEEHWMKGFIYEFDLWPLLIIFCLKAIFAIFFFEILGGILVFPRGQ